MDQRERIGAAIVAAINAVNTSIQKTQTYKDGNIFRLATDAVVEVAGASAIEASTKSLEVSTELIADDTAGVSTVANTPLDSQPRCYSEAAVGEATAEGILNVSTKLYGSAGGQGGGEARMGGVTRLLVGDDTAGAGGADAVFEIERILIGSAAGNSAGVAHDFESPPSNP